MVDRARGSTGLSVALGHGPWAPLDPSSRTCPFHWCRASLYLHVRGCLRSHGLVESGDVRLVCRTIDMVK